MFNQTIRVFLSSTFKDMKGERDALHRGAFRELRDYCEARGFQFQVIDLRWGVTEEAAWDQRTELLCLEEIRRCQRVTPRPNFLALVGQRYGWRPLPGTLSNSDWSKVSAQAENQLPLLRDWYFLDGNNAPPVYRLRPRMSAKERETVYWTEEVEIPLRELFLRCIAQSNRADLSSAVQETDISLTEKEIILGAEQASTNSWQSFAYFRELSGGKELGEPWVDLDRSGNQLADPKSELKLKALRQRLETHEKVTTRRYSARLENTQVDGASVQQLNEWVVLDLKAAIDQQIETFRKQSPLEREAEAHQVFSEHRRLNYVSRPIEEARAHEYISRAAGRPLIFHGASGAGKTAFMAALRTQIAERYPASLCVARFIGATGPSSDLRSLIASVHSEAAQATGAHDASEPMKRDPVASFRTALSMGREDKPLIVLLDALDQLSPEDRALSCGWIPRALPDHCHLIATCMTGHEEVLQTGSGVYSALAGRLDPQSMIELTAPSAPELQQMLSKWLGFYGRVLTEAQEAAANRAIQACPRPLFLRVLVEIARSWMSDTPVDKLPTSIPEIIETILTRIEREHGRPVVESTLGLLAASRSGLTEVEMVDLLDDDEKILSQFREASRYEYPDARKKLPPAVWSRLFFDLDFFLGDSTAAGLSVLSFYHRQLAWVARRRYLEPDGEAFHRNLARYFDHLPIRYAEERHSPNARRAYELPFQLRRIGGSESLGNLSRLLTDQEQVNAKIEAGLSTDLLHDYFEMELIESVSIEPLVSFFQRQYLAEGAPLAGAFEPGDLHSFFAFRGKALFYNSLLQSLAHSPANEGTGRARRIRSRARIDLGGLLRRQGKFEEARSLLQIVHEDSHGLKESDLGVGWYEIGYLHNVLDEYAEAARSMHRSVEFAEAGQDSVGAAISRSVELWSLYFDQPTAARLREIARQGEEALDVFTQRQTEDPRAVRWVMNALAHLANAAYLLQDAVQLRHWVRDLRANPWIREFESETFLLPYEARLAIAERRFQDAISFREKFFKERPVKDDTEGGAWSLFDYGISLAAVGRKTEAQEAFSRGLQLRQRGASNAFWQARIREEMAKLLS